MNIAAKAIWIDVDNSPHVPFFAPLIRHYRESGVQVILTARDHSQTIDLLRMHGLEGTFETIGKHAGGRTALKILGLIGRASALVSYIKKLKRKGVNICVAVSHGSRSMVLAARWLNIPVITMYDYEFTETGIFNRFSNRVLIPALIPEATLDTIGLPVAKRVRYEGLKEEIYLRYFRPAKGFREAFLKEYAHPLPDDTILVVLRPPATTANYHSATSEMLFHELLKHLLSAPALFTVIVPRTREQGSEIESVIDSFDLPGDGFLVLKRAVDGLDLAYAADLLISGGGTMNRESAILGVPVYSIFNGKLGALDAEMEKTGQIRFIRSPGDVAKIDLRKREVPAFDDDILTDRVENCVCEQINSFLDRV